MRLLLDTHVLLWWLAADPTLARPAREAIADPATEVFVSAASAWEIAIKRALGLIEAPTDLGGALVASAFEELPITVAHAELAGDLPRYHADPFDRMLVAQARLEGLTIVTRDLDFGLYGVPILEG